MSRAEIQAEHFERSDYAVLPFSLKVPQHTHTLRRRLIPIAHHPLGWRVLDALGIGPRPILNPAEHFARMIGFEMRAR